MSHSGSRPVSPRVADGAVQQYEGQVDYIISDYMERLGTRLNILETELKYAWRALDLLSQEYVKMWERLEKLEALLCEQQSVIAHLLELYTAEGGDLSALNVLLPIAQSGMGQLEVIREILGNGTVEDGLEEGVDVTSGAPPNEAFYRSLNQAYREDLVGGESSRPASQLGLIWEDPEESEESAANKASEAEVQKLMDEAMSEETQEIFSSIDYKYYRGNSPCVSEHDLAQLTRLNSMDRAAIEKLHELDRLTGKLQVDSQSIKELETHLLESPRIINQRQLQDAATSEAEARVLAEDSSIIDEQLRQMYTNPDWTFSSGSVGIDEIMLMASDSPNKKIESRLSTDEEVAEAMCTGFRSPRVSSPRHRMHHEPVSSSEPYSTVTGRLAYSSAVQNADIKSPKPAKERKFVYNPFLPGYDENLDNSNLISTPFSTVSSISPSIFKVTSTKPASPSPSICSARTRQDGYLESSEKNKDSLEMQVSSSPSPPPPAPQDTADNLMLPNASPLPGPSMSHSPVFLSAEQAQIQPSISSIDHGRLSPRTPHSPKSPRTSPKRKSSSDIVAAKSDSGLSSMSGWSSLEKSPGSPKSSKTPTSNYLSELNANRISAARTSSPMPPGMINPDMYPYQRDNSAYRQSSADSYMDEILRIPSCTSEIQRPYQQSAFTSLTQSVLSNGDLYNSFVPSPAPSSTRNVSHRYVTEVPYNEAAYRHQPAIYSVAGSNRQEVYTSVYTSNSSTSNAQQQALNYPDLIEPYGNDAYNQRFPPEPNYHARTSIPHSSSTHHHGSKRNLSRAPSTTSMPSEGMTNHEGYKTAMYRTMFPTGNLTDALVYYPTSTRYDSPVYNVPPAEYDEPENWAPREHRSPMAIPRDSTSGSIRSSATVPADAVQNITIEQRRYQQYQQQQAEYQRQQHIYQNVQTYNASIESKQLDDQYQKTWNQRTHYLELDLRNKNFGDQNQMGELFDAGGVIVSKSGYISISSDLKDRIPTDKLGKKSKRGSIKSAMNSVSHWLPDLNLKKRHRSNSLPIGVQREDLELSRDSKYNSSLKDKVKDPNRKKKKYPLVATMSGILQKAKRKTQHSDLSLSDPEQSETEWSGGRSSVGVSDSEEGSVFSESGKDMFAKVASSKKSKKPEPQTQVMGNQIISSSQYQQLIANGQQQQIAQDRQQPQLYIDESQYDDDFNQNSRQESTKQQSTEYQSDNKNIQFQQVQNGQVQQQNDVFQQMQVQNGNYQQTQMQNGDLSQQPLFAQVQKPKLQREATQDYKQDAETDLSDNVPGEEENSGKSTGSGSSSIFVTVGEAKRGTGSDESTTSENRTFPPVTLGGASMEFAVSRALGKYRKRRSTSASDDQAGSEDAGSKSDETEQLQDVEDTQKQSPQGVKTITTKSSPELLPTKSVSLEEPPQPESSPSASSHRSYTGRIMPRQQQSLDIPGGRGEDDDNRSTHSMRSGRSSRRQSTEESIDSEDEWYRYNVRRLEMEEQDIHYRPELSEPLREEAENEEQFGPDEDVKERMSFVLRELKMTVKPIPDVLEEKELNAQVIASAKRREKEQEGKKKDKNHKRESTGPKSVYAEFARITDYQTWRDADEKQEQEQEIESDVEAPKDEDEDRSEHSSGDTSGPDSPHQSMDEMEDEDYEKEQSTINQQPIKEGGALIRKFTGVPSYTSEPIPERKYSTRGEGWSLKNKTDSSSTSVEDQRGSVDIPDDQKDQGGPLGSKWKLLKALKERKAEEKTNQEKIQEAASTPQDKVSMRSIMQKLYEIGVKS